MINETDRLPNEAAEASDKKGAEIPTGPGTLAPRAEEGKRPEQPKKGIVKSLAEGVAGAAKSAVAKTKKSDKKSEKSEKSEKTDGTKKKSRTAAIGEKCLGGLMWAKMAIGGYVNLRRKADKVNKLNVFPVPDGDTGDNMRMTIESGIRALEKIDSDDLADVMRVLAHGMLLGARGNSGVILSQFFAGIAKGLDGVEEADAAIMGHALELGVEQAYASVMTPTEGTILTVAREATEYAVSRITPASTIRTLFADLVEEMNASLERTPEKLAALKEAEVVDSGGAGLLYIMDGINRVLNGEDITDDGEDETAIRAVAPSVTIGEGFGADSVMTYGYCTELLLQLQNSKCDPSEFDVDALRAFLAEIGDSIVAFKTDSIVKLHVHTFTPERVLEHCRAFGEFLTVKIENMSVQHTEVPAIPEDEPKAKAEAASPAAERKRYAVVAVTNGPGVEALYRDMGCDAIVPGGQTQNPSTNDFLDAFAQVNAEHIFAFPNNGNILMAARQAAEIYEAATVHVIPSKNIGSGYVALSSADLSAEDPEEIVAAMTEAMERVTAGYISPSIRDAEINGVSIKNGDTIGVIEKEIVVSTPDRHTAARETATRIMSGDKFMLTVFTGKDTAPEEAAALETELAELLPEAEIYLIEGGQDIYPYIFVAE